MSQTEAIVLDQDPFIRIFTVSAQIQMPIFVGSERLYTLMNANPIRPIDAKLYKCYRKGKKLEESLGEILYHMKFHFPFIPQALTLIRDITVVREEDVSYIIIFGLYNFIAWVCYYNRTHDPSHFKLVISSLFSMMKRWYNTATLSSFYYASRLYLQRSDSEIGPNFMGMLKEIFTQSNAVPCEMTELLVMAMQKQISMTNEIVTRQLIELISHLACNSPQLFTISSVNRLIDSMRPLLVRLRRDSLSCLQALLPLGDVESYYDLFRDLASSLISIAEREERIDWPVSKTPAVELKPVDDSEPLFKFKNTLTFGGKYCVGGSPFDAHPINLALVKGEKKTESLSLHIIMAMTNNSHASFFLNSLFKEIRERDGVDNLGNLLRCFHYCYKKCHEKMGNIMLGVPVSESKLFDPNMTIFDELENFEIVSALRTSTLMTILSEGVDIFAEVLLGFMKHPRLLADTLYRLVLIDSPFLNLVPDARIITVIYRIMNMYSKVANEDDSPLIEETRCAILYTIAHILDIPSMKEVMFGDLGFTKAFIAMLYEDSLQEFVTEHVKVYCADTDMAAEIVMTLSGTLIEVCKEVNDPRAVKMIINVLNTCTEVQKVNPGLSFKPLNRKICELMFVDNSVLTERMKELAITIIRFFRSSAVALELLPDETAMFSNGIKKIYQNNFTQDIYDELLLLVMEEIDGMPVVKHADMMRILFDVFSDSEWFDGLFSVLCDACTKNWRNAKSCHDAEIDMFLIQVAANLAEARETKKLQIVLKLLEAISSVCSSASVVHHYFSLLAKTGPDTISDYEPVFTDTLYNIIYNAYNKNHMTLPVGKCDIPACPVELVTPAKGGVRLNFWICLHKTGNTEVPLVELTMEENHIVLSMNENVISIDMNGTRYPTDIILQKDRWIILSFMFVHSCIIYSTNATPESFVQVDGTFKPASSVLVKPSPKMLDPSTGIHAEIGFIGLNEGKFTDCLTKCALSHPMFGPSSTNDFVLASRPSDWRQTGAVVTDLEEYPEDESFAFCLTKMLKLDLFIPMFTMMYLKFRDGTMWENASEVVWSILTRAVLCFGGEVQNGLAKTTHIKSISGILSYCPAGFLTYDMYLQIWSFFQVLTLSELRIQVFDQLLVNADLWMSASKEEHKKIIAHWAKIVFHSDITDCIGNDPFHHALQLLTAYIPMSDEDQTRCNDENINQDVFSSIHNILMTTARINFTRYDYRSIFVYAMVCKRRDSAELLIFVLKSIIFERSDKLKEFGFSAADAYLLHFLLNRRNIQMITDVFDIIIHLHKTDVMDPSMLSGHLDLLLKCLTIDVVDDTFFKAAITTMEMGNPELIPVCCWYVLHCNTEENQLMLMNSLNDLDPEKVRSNNTWYIWPVAVMAEVPLRIQMMMLNFLYKFSSSNWVEVFCSLRIVCSAMNKDSTDLQIMFLTKIYNGLVENPQVVTKPLLHTFFVITLCHIFRRMPGMNPGLEKEYYESPFCESEPDAPWIDKVSGSLGLLEKLLKVDCNQLTYGLVIGENGEWIHEPLAKALIRLGTEYNDWINPSMVLVLCYFVHKFSPSYVDEYMSSLSSKVCDARLEPLFDAFYQHYTTPTVVLFELVTKSVDDVRRSDSAKQMEQQIMTNLSSYVDVIESLNQMLRADIQEAIGSVRTDFARSKRWKNRKTWAMLWSQLSVEKGPWYSEANQSSDTVQFMREKTFCHMFCPFRMKRNVRQLRQSPISIGEKNFISSVFESSSRIALKGRPANAKTSSADCLCICDCEVITMMEPELYEFRLCKDATIELIREGDGKLISIQCQELKHILLRSRNHRLTAIEFFTNDGASFFVNFLGSKDDVVAIAGKIGSMCPKQSLLSLQQLPYAPYFAGMSIQDDWVTGRISNFDYLMMLNIVSGRTYNDITQYPIFPWILRDYTGETLDLSNEEIFRPLDTPVGSINREKFRAELMPEGNPDDSDDHETFMFTSGPSSPMSVCLYLGRLEPYSAEQMRIHGGKFDLADRQMESIAKMYTTVTNLSSESWELIPEFFFMPEFLTNDNHYPLGGDVELPEWSHNSPMNFIYLHRKALESDYVSQHLHEWIDLIWGFKQRGPEALAAHNVYDSALFETVWQERTDLKKEEIESYLKLVGQLPPQLFTTPHPARNILPEVKEPNARRILIPEKCRYASSSIRSGVISISVIGNDGSISLKQFNLKTSEPISSVELPEKLTVDLEKVSIMSIERTNSILMVEDTGLHMITTKSSEVKSNPNIAENKIVCAAGSGIWISAVSTDNVVHIHKMSDLDTPVHQFRCYRDSITCATISYNFRIHVIGTRDGSLIITSLKSGKTTKVIPLGDAVPLKLIVTPAWGFIVVMVREKVDGFPVHSLMLFTVNGLFVKKVELHCPVLHWVVWSVSRGFDYLAFVAEDCTLFACEVFYLNPKKLSATLPRKVMTVNYSHEASSLIATGTSRKGTEIVLISVQQDDFENINII